VSAALLIRPEAETDLAEAYRWYEDQKEGLGDKFLERVREQFDTIVAMPDIYAVVDRGVRRCKLKRFPYVVYYRQAHGRIEILAVLHGKRRPETWRTRLEK
jgi:toxin ParE1/3/4